MVVESGLTVLKASWHVSLYLNTGICWPCCDLLLRGLLSPFASRGASFLLCGSNAHYQHCLSFSFRYGLSKTNESCMECPLAEGDGFISL